MSGFEVYPFNVKAIQRTLCNINAIKSKVYIITFRIQTGSKQSDDFSFGHAGLKGRNIIVLGVNEAERNAVQGIPRSEGSYPVVGVCGQAT